MKNRNRFKNQYCQFSNSKLNGVQAIPTVSNFIPVGQISLDDSFDFYTAYRIIAIPYPWKAESTV